jgi:hypothetical protein
MSFRVVECADSSRASSRPNLVETDACNFEHPPGAEALS